MLVRILLQEIFKKTRARKKNKRVRWKTMENKKVGHAQDFFLMWHAHKLGKPVVVIKQSFAVANLGLSSGGFLFVFSRALTRRSCLFFPPDCFVGCNKSLMKGVVQKA
jgi:hypothetical protein